MEEHNSKMPLNPGNKSPTKAIVKKRRILVISNVLPVVFPKNSKPEWHKGWKGVFFKNLAGQSNSYDTLYIGCPQIYVPKAQEIDVEASLQPLGCLPVFLDPNTAHKHYQGFCRGTLWPVLHNVIDVYNAEHVVLHDDKIQTSEFSEGDWSTPRSWNPALQELCWSEYCRANRQFATRIIESFNDNDIVWIQDYHLLMVPSYLRRKLHAAVNVGIFLHTPFPSSEIFRSLSMREEILRAMLCADHIGFLSFEYARHFLTCCKRMLGLSFQSRPGGLLGIEYNGRHVMITCSHMGMTMTDIRSVTSIAKFSDLFDTNGIPEDCSIIACVDSMEMLSGITLKLLAFDRFLAAYPHKASRVVLALMGIALDSRPNDYNQCRSEVIRMVKMINNKWNNGGYPKVLFEERDGITCRERIAIWKAADIYLNTAVREGLNLKPFEYIVSRADNPGVAIVSEFCSCSRVLNGSICINPWKVNEVVEKISTALDMSEAERRGRHHIDMDFLTSHSIGVWAERMLEDIAIACKRDQELTYLDVGFGFGFRAMNLSANFSKLDFDDVSKSYRASKRRFLLFDYGGTLSPTQSVDIYMHKSCREILRNVDGHARTPITDDVRTYLSLLCDDPRNVVFVMSNASRIMLEHEFHGIDKLGLIADNGVFYRKSPNASWEHFISESASTSWMPIADGLMRSYVERTNGAFIVRSDISITYDYRVADPEFGELQANELSDNLISVLKNFPVEICRGQGYVEVHPSGVNKSTATTIALQYCSRQSDPEFILCIGDDTSDELAFKAVKTFAEKLNDQCHYFTCTIGKKPSEALSYVDTVNDVAALLANLSHSSSRSRERSGSLEYIDIGSAYQSMILKDPEPMITRVTSALTLEELARSVSKENLYMTAERDDHAQMALEAAEERQEILWKWMKIGVSMLIGGLTLWKIKNHLAKRSL